MNLLVNQIQDSMNAKTKHKSIPCASCRNDQQDHHTPRIWSSDSLTWKSSYSHLGQPEIWQSSSRLAYKVVTGNQPSKASYRSTSALMGERLQQNTEVYGPLTYRADLQEDTFQHYYKMSRHIQE